MDDWRGIELRSAMASDDFVSIKCNSGETSNGGFWPHNAMAVYRQPNK